MGKLNDIEKYFGNIDDIWLIDKQKFEKINKKIHNNIINGSEKKWIRVGKHVTHIHYLSFYIRIDDCEHLGFNEFRIWDHAFEFREDVFISRYNGCVSNDFYTIKINKNSITKSFNFQDYLTEHKKRFFRLKKINNIYGKK